MGRGGIGSYGHGLGSVGPGQFEGTEALHGTSEGSVLAHPLTEAKGASRFDEVDLQPARVGLEAVGESAEEPGGARANDRALQLDVARTGCTPWMSAMGSTIERRAAPRVGTGPGLRSWLTDGDGRDGTGCCAAV